jgi:Carbohydrate esterase, sialic acid-specific acetylesterase
MPVYLLAGQSNMVGSVDESLLKNFLTEFSSPAPNLEKRLDDRLWAFYVSIDPNGEYYTRSGAEYQGISKFQTPELIRLHREGFVGDQLIKPHPSVMCSFNGSKVEALRVNCGEAFGPELMMGHVLSKTLGSPTSLIKVAEGGTTLLCDWRSPSRKDMVQVPADKESCGVLYGDLSARIKSLASKPAEVHPDCASKKCQWSAFVYFQGENDAFEPQGAKDYEVNLRLLIADVRKEVGNPKLPVVIVQVGAWGGSVADGELVAKAQKKVAESDASARLVVTSDLSTYYHYDAAAQLIIGERVAKAVQALTVK